MFYTKIRKYDVLCYNIIKILCTSQPAACSLGNECLTHGMLDVVSLYRDRDASELDGKKLSRTRLVYYDNLLLLLIIGCALCTAPSTRWEEVGGEGGSSVVGKS